MTFSPLVIFSYEPNNEKSFQENLFFFFLKNDFVENILQRRIFYVETNGALISIFFIHSSKHEKYCFYEEDLKRGVFGPIEQFLHLLCFLDKI